MWGTDATRFLTEREDSRPSFAASAYHLDEVVGWHRANSGRAEPPWSPLVKVSAMPSDRSARTGARVGPVRCDRSPQYIAGAWTDEANGLGSTISPSYVGNPECNGVAEGFMRTLKKQCIDPHHFPSLGDSRHRLSECVEALQQVA